MRRCLQSYKLLSTKVKILNFVTSESLLWKLAVVLFHYWGLIWSQSVSPASRLTSTRNVGKTMSIASRGHYDNGRAGRFQNSGFLFVSFCLIDNLRFSFFISQENRSKPMHVHYSNLLFCWLSMRLVAERTRTVFPYNFWLEGLSLFN